jgi:hypothetical protein
MAKLAGSPDFFSDMKSGLDKLKTGMEQSRNHDTRSFGSLTDGLDKMKRAKDSAPKARAATKPAAKKPAPKKK